jgi:hypothetical protein
MSQGARWELALYNVSWVCQLRFCGFHSIQRHRELPYYLLKKNRCIDTKYSIHSILMNEQCVSMQPIAPAWVSATPLWDHQTFHINCQRNLPKNLCTFMKCTKFREKKQSTKHICRFRLEAMREDILTLLWPAWHACPAGHERVKQMIWQAKN